jgi:dynein heavy chain
LPLEPFDDTEYDCRMPEEWIAFGETEDGEFYPVPGKGLKKEADGRATWEDILITTYDAEKKIYIGNWDDENFAEARLSRINLLFNAEDPRIFAQRIAQAHSERIYADS